MTGFITMPAVEGRQFTGWDGRYRLYTITDGIDFDSLTAYEQGGPPLAPVGGWNVSTSSGDDRPGVHTLHVWRGDPHNPRRHQIDRTEYPSRREADRAAYAAGVHGFMIYENRAFRYGLPVEVTAATDLAELVGVRVRIERPAIGSQGAATSVHYGVFESLRHSRMIPESAGGILIEEPHGTCRGGATGFSVPYGSTITIAEGNHA